ncbi:MAG TPA: hypothetical protein VHZ95_08550 [Polyangiales bacterium]|nr:hypothetical protein [Polyangiales bacterium]
MLARYKRVARTFSELQTGDLEPLDVAIPELRAEPPLDMGVDTAELSARNHGRPQRDLKASQSRMIPKPYMILRQPNCPDRSSTMSGGQSAGNGVESTDPSEAALAGALIAAIAARGVGRRSRARWSGRCLACGAWSGARAIVE